MSGCKYVCPTSSAVSLTANQEKAVIGVMSGPSFGLKLAKIRVGFTGTSGAPAQVTLYACTFAANPPGTASTTVTPVQISGPAIPAGFTAAQNWTSMPTLLTRVETIPLTPNGGLLVYDVPLGDEPVALPDQGWVLAVNSPVAVSAWGSLWVERC